MVQIRRAKENTKWRCDRSHGGDRKKSVRKYAIKFYLAGLNYSR
jgi:hypothetical protein